MLLCQQALLLGPLVLVTACASTAHLAHAQSAGADNALGPRVRGSSSGSPRPGGFYLDDGPGDAPPDLNAIPDAIPRNEPLSGAANRPYEALGEVQFPDTSQLPFSERGLASWYGRRFHGRRTASGERYDMYGMTAAHKTLPIPSYARVTNLETGKAVIVRVNDRGPFHPGRVIDLSYTAASKLGFAGKGSTEVLVERVFPPGFGDGVIIAAAPPRRAALLAQNTVTDPGARVPAGALPIAEPGSEAFETPLTVHGTGPATAPPETFVPTDTPVAPMPVRPAVPETAHASVPETARAAAPETVHPAVADTGHGAPANAPMTADPGNKPDLEAQARQLGQRVLQLGAFRDVANARRLFDQARVALHDLPGALWLDTEGGLSRVRFGPFPDKDAQSAAAALIERTLHLKPGVVGP